MQMALALITLARETRVGSPLDFQLKRVSAPNCLRALNRSAKAGRRAARVSDDQCSETFVVYFYWRLLSVLPKLTTFAGDFTPHLEGAGYLVLRLLWLFRLRLSILALF